MKLVTFEKDSYISCGLIKDDAIIDINQPSEDKIRQKTILQILQEGPESLQKLQQLQTSPDNLIPLDSVKLLAPIPRPGKVIALAGNYSEHIKEAGLSLGLSDSPRNTTVPRPFIMPPTVIIGHEDTIPWPDYSDQIDYELELAIIIGRKAKSVPPQNALDYVAGYTIANDVSARSVTFATGRAKRPWDEFYDWLNGKWADGFLPTGPYLVTKDEIENVQNLDMQLTVNGQIRQKANTSQMIYAPADIVSFLSHIMTLEPGDIIATGTPSGVAIATGNWLCPGDVIECTIQGLGKLKNTLGQKSATFYKPLEN